MILEYVWLDGYKPEPNLRSKIQVTDSEIPPMWSFDGSSTQQADGGNSDCVLNPVSEYKLSDKTIVDALVMCEVLDSDGGQHNSY